MLLSCVCVCRQCLTSWFHHAATTTASATKPSNFHNFCCYDDSGKCAYYFYAFAHLIDGTGLPG